ncbi:TetR/AcrR family transcriptional regulator [Amycolatopsis sp. NPDC059021]|uniref:TetR/AcrR family transcriptional regulator n=1 Tax=Amycolatopsis sp. NPDC059021 TaxID=3346704 RepID=UPI0036732265
MCRTPLPAAERGRPPTYCSRACQAKAYRQRKNPPVPEPPERATHSPRRRQIAEAVWRIAAERGLEAASMREIAAEAGVSLRVVQYHFESKHQLLVSALEMLHEENNARGGERVGTEPLGPRALLAAVLDEFLPLDEQRRTALRVLSAYFARSLTDPALAAVFLHNQHPLEDLVTELVRQGQRSGLADRGLDPGYEADLLVSGVIGLGIDILHERRSAEEVRHVIGYHLDRIFPAARP